MATMDIDVDGKLPNEWTLYFHSLREKRWSIDTFQKVGTAKNLRDALAIFKELGEKLKRGMFFWMRDPIPPLWENYQNIRGGSYSVRGGQDEGTDIYKKYVLGSMMGAAVTNTEDQIMGVSISPKVLGQGAQQRIGFYVIKIWNRDAEKYNKNTGIHCLDKSITHGDILYTPHVEKKM
jgi:hypothetical protein